MASQASTYQIVASASRSILVPSTIGGTLGYLTAYTFNIMNPVSAAILSTSQAILTPITRKLFNTGATSINETARKVEAFVASFILSTLAGVGILTALGMPITFKAILILTLTRTAISAFIRAFIDVSQRVFSTCRY